MQYQVGIRENNIKAHLDIEDAIKKLGNGQFTCTIRLDKGDIVDVTTIEYVDTKSYGTFKQPTSGQYTFSYDTSNRSV